VSDTRIGIGGCYIVGLTFVAHVTAVHLPPSTMVRSFVRSLWAGVQPTLDPSAETFSWSSALAQGQERNLVGV